MKRRVLIGRHWGHSSSGAIESRSLSREGRVSGEGRREGTLFRPPPVTCTGWGWGASAFVPRPAWRARGGRKARAAEGAAVAGDTRLEEGEGHDLLKQTRAQQLPSIKMANSWASCVTQLCLRNPQLFITSFS